MTTGLNIDCRSMLIPVTIPEKHSQYEPELQNDYTRKSQELAALYFNWSSI